MEAAKKLVLHLLYVNQKQCRASMCSGPREIAKNYSISIARIITNAERLLRLSLEI